MTPEPPVVTREYGLSRADVERVLPRLLADAEVVIAAQRIEARYADGRTLSAHLGPERERRLGALRLVSIMLSFRFQGFEPAAVRAFMTRFERATHKGGG